MAPGAHSRLKQALEKYWRPQYIRYIAAKKQGKSHEWDIRTAQRLYPLAKSLADHNGFENIHEDLQAQLWEMRTFIIETHRDFAGPARWIPRFQNDADILEKILQLDKYWETISEEKRQRLQQKIQSGEASVMLKEASNEFQRSGISATVLSTSIAVATATTSGAASTRAQLQPEVQQMRPSPALSQQVHQRRQDHEPRQQKKRKQRQRQAGQRSPHPYDNAPSVHQSAPVLPNNSMSEPSMARRMVTRQQSHLARAGAQQMQQPQHQPVSLSASDGSHAPRPKQP